MYKNRLQEFTTRSDFAIHVYLSINEGQPHDPKFRSIVWVVGISYTSQYTFSQKKVLNEKHLDLVWKYPWEDQTRDEGPLMYKNRLQEFTARLGFAISVYKIVNERQPHDLKFR